MTYSIDVALNGKNDRFTEHVDPTVCHSGPLSNTCATHVLHIYTYTYYTRTAHIHVHVLRTYCTYTRTRTTHVLYLCC